jgi:hypothetical protein
MPPKRGKFLSKIVGEPGFVGVSVADGKDSMEVLAASGDLFVLPDDAGPPDNALFFPPFR